jgi:hypothetical protein
MNGFREKPRQSLAYARSVKALTGTNRDSAPRRSPDDRAASLWRPVGDDDLATVDGDYYLAITVANVYLDMRRVSSYRRHVDLLARRRDGQLVKLDTSSFWFSAWRSDSSLGAFHLQYSYTMPGNKTNFLRCEQGRVCLLGCPSRQSHVCLLGHPSKQIDYCLLGLLQEGFTSVVVAF